MFLQALWHMLKVVSVAGYWLLTVYFVWGGFAQLSRPFGWPLLGFVVALFAARLYIGGRFVPVSTAYIMAFAAYMAVVLVSLSIA